MVTSKVSYPGHLRTQCRHERSGTVILTDAPTDNMGKGESFSPTDLVATALVSCMITIMGIVADSRGWDITGTRASVIKRMTSAPRRISELHVELLIKDRGLKEDQKLLLQEAAINCPVAKSIHTDIVQKVNFEYVRG